ncbi:hypothetical protein [Nocardia panacis]|uniref:hypothetical protein n=1 Tax=Nocardia panacis TaxID=2340916 RepID=UPI0011C49E30|nr:hypothetical protein [Nocardia panacis]
MGVILLGTLTGAAMVGGCSTSSSTSAPGSSSSAPGSAISAPPPVIAPPPVVVPPPAIVPPSDDQTTQAPPITTSQPAPPTTTAAPQPPNHPTPGTTIPGEGLTLQQAADLQKSVDNGHQPWRLDRVQVAKFFVQARFDWTNVQTSTGAPMIVFVTNQDGSKVTLHLTQPATHGDHGIWVVESGVWD